MKQFETASTTSSETSNLKPATSNLQPNNKLNSSLTIIEWLLTG
jgi:hypothetical protein